MKRFLFLTALAAAALLTFSCKGEPTTAPIIPIIEFEQQAYTVFGGSSTSISLVLSEPAPADVSIAISFGGEAEKGTDYTVSSESVTIKAGESKASFTLTDVSLSAEKSVTLTLTAAPQGYALGTKTVAFVTVDAQEALIFSFNTPEIVVLETNYTTVSIKSSRTPDYKPDKDLTIPLKWGGEGVAEIEVPASVTIKAGETDGHITITPKKETLDKEVIATLSVDNDAAPRFIPGDTDKQVIHVRGLQDPAKLVGKWELVRMLDAEEIPLWFSEYSEGEDDLDALPLNNDGLTLTFSVDDKGVGTVVAGGSGSHDFNKYLTSSTFTLAEPNISHCCSGYLILGKYSVQENNMFVGEDYKYGAYLVYTYYNLQSVCFNFDGDTDATASAQIAIAITPSGEMVIQIRDYSLEDAPFGEMTHMMCDYEFEPDLCSFPMLLKKVE